VKHIVLPVLALFPSAPAAAQSAKVTQWRPVNTPRWAPGAMYDAATAIRKGDNVTAWIRFVDMPGHSPAEMKEVAATLPRGAQIDSYMTLDCVKPRFRIDRMRITDTSGKILSEKDLTGTTQLWEPLRPRSRGTAIKPQICTSVK
jgi:hypothetical protein